MLSIRLTYCFFFFKSTIYYMEHDGSLCLQEELYMKYQYPNLETNILLSYYIILSILKPSTNFFISHDNVTVTVTSVIFLSYFMTYVISLHFFYLSPKKEKKTSNSTD